VLIKICTGIALRDALIGDKVIGTTSADRNLKGRNHKLAQLLMTWKTCPKKAGLNEMEMKSQTDTPLQRMRIKEGQLGSSRPNGEFAKSLSHDLHTPLNVIIGLCQLLERDRTTSLSTTQRDAVQRIDRNARALLETSNRLLARLRTGTFK
jgi:signal transduction histidine kinase